MKKLALGLAMTVAAALVAASSAGAARSIVLKNGEVGCSVDRGDVPGFGAFLLPSATQVFRADGGGLLSCHGWLPHGATLAHTFVGSVPCGDAPGVSGRITVTRSGRVNAFCVFPAGSL